MSRTGLLVAAAALAIAAPAGAQGWQDYDYPDAGFSVQFPAPPTLSAGTYQTASGALVPAKIYALRQDGVTYTVTVADYSALAADPQGAIADAVSALSQTGEVKADIAQQIDMQHGRDLTIVGKDGSRSAIAVFFFDRRLYELNGTAPAGDVDAASGLLVRFQQTLSFLDDLGKALAEPPKSP